MQETPYGVRLVVGDVRGKGLEAVETVAVVIGAFREAAEQEADLARVAGRLDHALHREGRGREGIDRVEGFTTALLVEVVGAAGTIGATGAGVLRLVNCGHPAPLLMLPDGTVSLLEPPEHALPLGLLGLLGSGTGGPPVPYEVDFPLGATLLVHTDGLSEARDEKGEFYQPGPRIRHHGWQRLRPPALLDRLLADVDAYTGGQAADDMALLAVTRRTPQ